MLRRMISRWRAPAGRPLPLLLHTRRDCHLCDVMKAEIREVSRRIPVELTEVDIDTDPELVERYGRSIPVLSIAGRVAFKGRLTAADLERKLERRARELEQAGE